MIFLAENLKTESCYLMQDMKKKILELMDEDYKAFITALISIEKNINNDNQLDKVYYKWLNVDVGLIDDYFDELIKEAPILDMQ